MSHLFLFFQIILLSLLLVTMVSCFIHHQPSPSTVTTLSSTALDPSIATKTQNFFHPSIKSIHHHRHSLPYHDPSLTNHYIKRLRRFLQQPSSSFSSSSSSSSVLYSIHPTHSLLHLSSSLSLYSPVPWIITSVVCGAAPTPIVVQAIRIWYKRISLPSYTPPDRLFAPIWTILYAMIGHVFYAIFISSHKHSKGLLVWFFIHYCINISWAPIFFGLKNLRLGHCLNILLVSTVYPVIPCLYGFIDKKSALLLVPYALWLTFASKLSHDICKLNPTDKQTGFNNATFYNDLYLKELQQE